MGGCRAKEGVACEARLEAPTSAPELDGHASAVGQSAELLNGVSGVSGQVVGHASPIWASGASGARAAQNAALSNRRAAHSSQALELLLKEGAAVGLFTYDVGLSAEDHPVGEVSADGVGDQETLKEADGDVESDDPQLRRAEIHLTVRHQVQGEAPIGMPAQGPITIPAHCEDHTSKRWGLKLLLAGGAGHMGVGVTIAMGELINWSTQERVKGAFAGAGFGGGASTPGAAIPQWNDWTTFGTFQPVSFEAFDGVGVEVNTASLGAMWGYSATALRFPSLSASTVDLSGCTAGNVGADVSWNFGTWRFIEALPKPTCHPETLGTGDVIVDDYAPYTYEIETTHSHVLYFGTGVDTLNDEALLSLQTFVQDCLASPQVGAAR